MRIVAKIWAFPREGTASQASKMPILETDSNETSEESCPGKWSPWPWTKKPTNATMATRLCLSSAARNQASVSSDPTVASPRGSKLLIGLVLPAMSSRPARTAVPAFFRNQENRGCFVRKHSEDEQNKKIKPRLVFAMRDSPYLRHTLRSKGSGGASSGEEESNLHLDEHTVAHRKYVQLIHAGSNFLGWLCVALVAYLFLSTSTCSAP
mmetsp:Transcript_32731/g.75361  ORF Transcript_32731/g.75361 Transcript_32731/m.75361 type:complete len:209 (-) Transcript_32731:195-821(-)